MAKMIYINERWGEPVEVYIDDPAYFCEEEGSDCLYHAVDLTGWNYTIDANNVVILEDYIGPDVTTLTIPNLRNV